MQLGLLRPKRMLVGESTNPEDSQLAMLGMEPRICWASPFLPTATHNSQSPFSDCQWFSQTPPRFLFQYHHIGACWRYMLNLFPFFSKQHQRCCSHSRMSWCPSWKTLRGEALVSNISFPDYDLDYDDVGGTLSWEQPQDISQVRMFLPPVN